ncbi:hypothetical protein Pmar_PMAR004020, partial [Perkinsus marinus ATCC 50983]
VVTQYTSPIRGPILPSMAPIIVLQHSSCSPPQRRGGLMRRTTTSDMGPGDSLYHPGEADIVVRLVERLSRRTKDICVICMYKAMVQEMKDRHQLYHISASGTFISDPQRANVAISRGKDHLVVVGH